jgi:hypothetical protein
MKIRKKLKDILVTITVVALIICVGLFCTRNIWRYKYKLIEDGTLEVVGYIGNPPELHIPSSVLGIKVTSINIGNIHWGKDIELVDIPDTVVEIKSSSFDGCGKLTVLGGENVEIIGEYVFAQCELVNGFPQWDNLRVIGNMAFYRTTGIEEVILGDSVEYIGTSAFSSSDLKNINIPSNMKFIGSCAFHNTEFSENIQDYMSVGENILISIPLIEKVIVPYGTMLISNCDIKPAEKDIKEIYIPDTVTSIEKQLIFKTEGVTIYIPSSVEQIGGFDDYKFDNYLLCVDNDMDKVTLVVESGSYAESYAIENGINYEIVDSVQALYEAAVF